MGRVVTIGEITILPAHEGLRVRRVRGSPVPGLPTQADIYIPLTDVEKVAEALRAAGLALLAKEPPR